MTPAPPPFLTVRLRDVCNVSCGMPTSRAKSRDEKGRGLMAVTFPSIQPGAIDTSVFQSFLASQHAFESLAVPGTILMKVGAPFSAAIVPGGIGEAFVGSNVLVLTMRADAPVSAEYLVAYLNSAHCAHELAKLAAASHGRLPMLRAVQVKGMSIPVPTAAEQQRLADLFGYTAELSGHLAKLKSLEWDRYNTVFFDVMDRGAINDATANRI